jgi:polysaccharide pyruvyl transferase WcaK-like protein
MNIYIIGYFNHYNIGDEQYKITFNYIFETYLPNKDNYCIKYIDCDLLKNIDIIEEDIIIIGGGDILNNYFVNQIIKKFIANQNKIIAVSVGLPYTSMLTDTNKLCILDYLYIRTNQDIDLFNNFINPIKISYLPDISYYLLNCKLTNPTFIYQEFYKKLSLIKKKKICISLNRHIYNIKTFDNYKKIIKNFSDFVIYLINKNYHIVFLPFNTSNSINNYDLIMENDILIHTDVINELKPELIDNITNINFALDTMEIINLYDLFYLSIPMRFHACLFSIYKKVPLLPIFTQRKIKNLLLDINWEFEYKLPANDKDIPTNLDANILINLFEEIIKKNNLKDKLIDLCENLFKKYLDLNIPTLIQKITKEYEKESIIKQSNFDDKINKLFIKLQNLAVRYGYRDFREVDNQNIKTLIVKITSYYLTNNLYSSYNYGLNIKMFDKNYNFDHIKEWKWIIKDYISKDLKPCNNPEGIFNLSYIEQSDDSKVHRFGWQYIYENIKYMNNVNSELYFDLYLDRTFHWEKKVLKLIGVIPYKNPWVGFIHHTFDSTFSSYNNYNLLKDNDFIESLKCCKGLFVLSETLKNKLIEELNKINIYINVYSFIHPSKVSNIPTFSYSKFKENKDKKIIHIGGWLRNIFSFYNLKISEYVLNKNNWNIFCKDKKYKFRKVAIKNLNMDNYFPDKKLFDNLKKIISDENKVNIISNCSQQYSEYYSSPFDQNLRKEIIKSPQIYPDNSELLIESNPLHLLNQVMCSQNVEENINNWHKHFYEYANDICNTVEIIDRLENEEYDKILTENIVFINLVDASAVNTLIECLIRNTPIIINKHPAVIELLGNDYPLYYNINDNNIMELLLNTNIKKATIYLEKLDKSKFEISYFIKNLKNTIAYISNPI